MVATRPTLLALVIAYALSASAARAQDSLAVAGQTGAVPPSPASAVTRPVAFGAANAARQSRGTAGASTLAFFDGTELSGFIDVYYGYNVNRPESRQTQLRAFDGQHNSFSLNLAELALEKKPRADSRGGFRLDLDYGPATTLIHATEPGGAQTFQHIGQAYLSYLAPAGSGLQVDFGKFSTPVGLEVVKTRDNWNYSRSLVFLLAQPIYHAGLRVAWTANNRLAVAAHLVNGWNNVVDNNGGKTVALQATLKPSAAVTIVQTYMGGPEQNDDNSDWRHLSDTVVTCTATPKVTLALNYDYGRDTVNGTTVAFQGLAAHVRYQASAWFALTPRVEYYDDGDGFTTGTSQKLKEVTLTGELKHKDGVTMRLEYRRDISNQPIFVKRTDGHVTHQDTLTIGLVYAFSSKSQ